MYAGLTQDRRDYFDFWLSLSWECEMQINLIRLYLFTAAVIIALGTIGGAIAWVVR
jgi:hypothetical protein